MHNMQAPHLYFIQSNEGCIKIGRSIDPSERLKTLQTGNAHKLRLLLVLEGKGYMEFILHEKLRRYRLTGEWFRLDGLASLPVWIYEQFDLDKVNEWTV